MTDFYSWYSVKEAAWNFGMALGFIGDGLRNLWWALASFAEWSWYSLKGESDDRN